MRAEFDRHRLGALIEVERGDVGRIVKTGEQAPLAEPRQHPMGKRGEAVDLADHLLLAGPQAGAQVRIERYAAAGLAHARHQFERHLPGGFRQRWRDASGVQVSGIEQLGHDRVW
ncbi:hypothetical protein D9M71_769210 [compost metagenome]